jgi:hypothetical protein
MNGQEAFRRLANQLRTAGGSGGGPAPKGLFAGSGILISLIAGAFAVNASLFNGMIFIGECIRDSYIWLKWMVVIVL